MYRIQSLWDHLPNPIKALCDAAAIGTTWTAAFGLVQNLFGAIGAVISVAYLIYRFYGAVQDRRAKRR
jgi:hypothetical protein